MIGHRRETAVPVLPSTVKSGDPAGHLLQHRGGRAIARKKRQAHTRVAHCNGCLTGAVTSAPSVGEPARHPLDRMGFYGFGQTLKPAICEKYHSPKNSKNTCTDATTADDCGVMSLGHSHMSQNLNNIHGMVGMGWDDMGNTLDHWIIILSDLQTNARRCLQTSPD